MPLELEKDRSSIPWAIISWAPALALAVFHWVAAVSASKHNSITFDEVAHVAGGMGSLQYSDYRLNPENGILPQMLAAAAMFAGGGRLPDVSDEGSRDGMAWKYSDSWELGYRTIYEVGPDAQGIVLMARGAMALCGALTVMLVHCIARYVHHGDFVGSIIPAILTSACPTMLAHGPLITSDAFFTLFVHASAMAIYAMLLAAADKGASVSRISCVSVVAGVSVGCTITAKHSGAIIAPLALFLLLSRLSSTSSRSLAFAARASFAISVSVAAAFVTVWAPFRFRYSAFAHMPCEQWKGNWDAGLGSLHGELRGLPAQLVQIARDYRLLPENFLYGIGYAFLSTQSRASFLAGMHGMKGWRIFFPYAVLVKTPIGVFALLVMGAVAGAWCRVVRGNRGCDASEGGFAGGGGHDKEHESVARVQGRGGEGFQGGGELDGGAVGGGQGARGAGEGGDDETWSWRLLPISAWAALYSFVAIQQNLNIGHRHMLPVYPAAYILCGFTCRFFHPINSSRSVLMQGAAWVLRLLVVAAVIGTLYEVAMVHPYHIAFFNGFAGGPAMGYTHLVDSSLDWGQGLPALRDFVQAKVAAQEKEQGQPPLMFYISYFGLGNPTYWNLTKGEGQDYQVHHLHSSIAGVSVPKHVQEINPYLLPGYYCIGASMLQPVYNKHAPGNWNAYYEALYRRQARFLLRMLTVREDHRAFIFSGQLPLLSDMPRMLVWMDSYRIARMGAHFKETKPYAQPGYAFNVYKVESMKELKRLLYGPAPLETGLNDIAHLTMTMS